MARLIRKVPCPHGYAVVFPDCVYKGKAPPGADTSLILSANEKIMSLPPKLIFHNRNRVVLGCLASLPFNASLIPVDLMLPNFGNVGLSGSGIQSQQPIEIVSLRRGFEQTPGPLFGARTARQSASSRGTTLPRVYGAGRTDEPSSAFSAGDVQLSAGTPKIDMAFRIAEPTRKADWTKCFAADGRGVERRGERGEDQQ